MRQGQGAPAGIGGWLLFFVISLGVLTPIRALAAIPGMFGPQADPMFASRLMLLSELALQLLIVVGCVTSAALLVFRKRWRSVRVTIIVLWTLSVLSVLAVLLSEAWWLARTGAMSPDSLIVLMIPMPLYAAIWTAYLLKSRRVANTYSRPGAVDAQVFS